MKLLTFDASAFKVLAVSQVVQVGVVQQSLHTHNKISHSQQWLSTVWRNKDVTRKERSLLPLRGCSRRSDRFHPAWDFSQHTLSVKGKACLTVCVSIMWRWHLYQWRVREVVLPWSRAVQLWWRRRSRLDRSPRPWRLHRLQKKKQFLSQQLRDKTSGG